MARARVRGENKEGKRSHLGGGGKGGGEGGGGDGDGGGGDGDGGVGGGDGE